MTCYIGFIAVLLPMIRSVMIWHICINLIGIALWIGSIHTEWPNQLALIWVALFIDIVGQVFFVLLLMLGNRVRSVSQWMGKVFEFYPGQYLIRSCGAVGTIR